MRKKSQTKPSQILIFKPRTQRILFLCLILYWGQIQHGKKRCTIFFSVKIEFGEEVVESSDFAHLNCFAEKFVLPAFFYIQEEICRSRSTTPEFNTMVIVKTGRLALIKLRSVIRDSPIFRFFGSCCFTILFRIKLFMKQINWRSYSPQFIFLPFFPFSFFIWSRFGRSLLEGRQGSH